MVLLVACLTLHARERLGNNDAARRRVVRRALLALGDDSVPFLKHALRDKDPEVRRAAAELLDALCARAARGARRNPSYEVPGRRATGLVVLAGDRRVAAEMLGRPLVRTHYAPRFRGVLAEWHDPTPADWCALLETLVAHARASSDGPDVEHVMVVDAVSWRIGQAGRALHWSVEWCVRRTVLPALAEALARRGPALSGVETAVYKDLLDRLARFCDAGAGCLCLHAGLASAEK
ncbi:MAG: HEAT repeat domain-containing protein [Planctomycetota bacterium]